LRESAIPAPSPQWPDPLVEEAYCGLAGQIVRTIERHTEADPAALLLQFLVSLGNVIGHSAHFVAEATPHALNLFAALVGATSKGRKGTSFDHIRRIFKAVDPDWVSNRVQSGLSSGEGLIYAVRDSVISDDDPEIVLDKGVEDKRLLVVESEFASPLKMLKREGNVLSPTIRQAWDSGDLRILNKNSPTVATGAHIAVIGHISAEELRKELDSSSTANGFANRFLWACVRRTRILPDGGQLDPQSLQPLIEQLKEVVVYGRATSELRRDAGAAKELWHAVYPSLSEGRPGLAGGMTARAEAQVMRLACLYALTDRSTKIRKPHLEAALALWKYLDDSVRFLFGDALGDPTADRILSQLREKRPDGLTRTAIRDLFSRHAASQDIERALELLKRRGLARVTHEGTEGRPVETWFAI
jgi:hypothetical protein